MPTALRSPTAEDTRAIGEAVAALLRPGDTVILTGDLGAGKTTLVQGVARGLGIDDRITSPTFVLVHEHEGRLPITHADLYRLDRLQDVVELELVDHERVLLVEWGDAADEVLPPDRLRIELTTPGDGEVRSIAVDAAGPSWRGRAEQLVQLLDPWEVPS